MLLWYTMVYYLYTITNLCTMVTPTISLKLPASELNKIDAEVLNEKAINRSDYARQAIREKLYRDMGARE